MNEDQPTADVGRRTFLKTSALTGVGAAFLSTGIALGQGSAAAPTSGSSDVVTVSFVGRDLGLDKLGERQEARNDDNSDWKWIPSTISHSTLPHDPPLDGGLAPNPPPKYLTILATVNPPSAAASVQFTKGGSQQICIDINVPADGRNTSSGIVKIQVTAKNESTPDASGNRVIGGTFIQATYGGSVKRTENFYVLIPKKIDKNPPTDTVFPVAGVSGFLYAEYQGQPVDSDLLPGQTTPCTEVMTDEPITVLDQFGAVLPSFYEGVAVKEAKTVMELSGPTQKYFWMAWMFSYGYYNDRVGIYWGAPPINKSNPFGTTANPIINLPFPVHYDIENIMIGGWLLSFTREFRWTNYTSYGSPLYLTNLNLQYP